MGLPTQGEEPRKTSHERPQTATDELVCDISWFNPTIDVEAFITGNGTLQKEDA